MQTIGQGSIEGNVALTQFTAYLEDVGRIGARHETLRQFYISVNSALFVYLSLAGKDGLLTGLRDGVLLVVGLVGILICALWFFHMGSFSKLYDAKFHTLREIEKKLAFPLFAIETEKLDDLKYTRITAVDRAISVAFGILFGALLYFKLNI